MFTLKTMVIEYRGRFRHCALIFLYEKPRDSKFHHELISTFYLIRVVCYLFVVRRMGRINRSTFVHLQRIMQITGKTVVLSLNYKKTTKDILLISHWKKYYHRCSKHCSPILSIKIAWLSHKVHCSRKYNAAHEWTKR